MCLAVPSKVTRIRELIATVDLYEVLKEISLLPVFSPHHSISF
jgi:hydrogenase maturation factor